MPPTFLVSSDDKAPEVFTTPGVHFSVAGGYVTVCDLPVDCTSQLCVLACHSMVESGCIQTHGSRRELVVPLRFDR